MRPSIAEKRRAFRDLHRDGCFVIPNPYDVGSALYLQRLGFRALATTSAGAAWALGLPDNGVTCDVMLDHIRSLVEATDLPVNADFGNAFSDNPVGVARNVRLCVETGVAGLSVEDRSGDVLAPLYELPLAEDRIRAARGAIDAAGADTVLVARTECYLERHPDPLKEAIHRLQRFAAAGADCLYAPGVRSREDIAAIVSAVAPKPVNVLIGAPIGLTVADLAALGVRRISVGGALARAAWGGFMAAAQEIADAGTFDTLGKAANYADLNTLFAGRTA